MKYDVEALIEYQGERVRFSGFLPGNYEEIDPARKHPAVIILAGGAYWRRSPREKEPVALQFLARGISPWVLEYSVAPKTFPQALCETLTAVSWLRDCAGTWNIDPGGISVCGFSAGGHLAASTVCFWSRDFIQDLLGRPGDRVRPDRLLLCYPVITAGEWAHQESIRCLLGEERARDGDARALVSLERQVGEDFPPAFLWHTAEDASVPVANTLLLGSALAARHVPFELHVYPKGRHGLSTGDFTSCGELAYGERYGCSDWLEKAVDFICGNEN